MLVSIVFLMEELVGGRTDSVKCFLRCLVDRVKYVYVYLDVCYVCCTWEQGR